MRLLQRDYYGRKAVGIYRREFHWIPNHGPGSINRLISGCNRLGDVGIKKLHFFESVGRPGFVGIRQHSCHQCLDACAVGKFADCRNSARCGHYRILQLDPKTAIPRASTRSHRENGAIAFAEAANHGAFFVVDKSIDSTEKFTLFSIAKDSMLRTADEHITADSSGHVSIRKGQEVIDGVRYSCVSPGGTVFAPTGLEAVVPLVDILAFDLDLDELDTSRRTMRNHTRKWQLSSEDHSRILRLMNATLDDQVAAALGNVSGRS